MGQSMIQNIKLYLLENNTGQIPGVKENPRDLTGDGFAKAKQSIKDFPEMLEVRTLVVVKHEDRLVVIGGNQRLRAMRDLDYDTAPVMVVDWPVDKINEFIIKDNIEYGVWNFDLLANEWDSVPLVDWGMNLPVVDIGFDDVEEIQPYLPSGERTTLCSMEFILSQTQRDFIKYKIDNIDKSLCSDPEALNNNQNGNALFYLFEKFIK